MTQRTTPTRTTLDRLEAAKRQLTKAAARLIAGDTTAAADADEAIRVVNGIMAEIRTTALDPGHGGPLSDGTGKNFDLNGSTLR